MLAAHQVPAKFVTPYPIRFGGVAQEVVTTFAGTWWRRRYLRQCKVRLTSTSASGLQRDAVTWVSNGDGQRN